MAIKHLVVSGTVVWSEETLFGEQRLCLGVGRNQYSIGIDKTSSGYELDVYGHKNDILNSYSNIGYLRSNLKKDFDITPPSAGTLVSFVDHVLNPVKEPQTKVRKAKTTPVGKAPVYRIPPPSGKPGGTGIGDLVRLNVPIQGYPYAQIKGFIIDRKNQGVGLMSPTPFAGAKVLRFSATLKASPYSKQDYGPAVQLDFKTFVKVDVYRETEWWMSLGK